MFKKILISCNVLLSIVGLFFISILTHEGVHLYQFKDFTTSQSVCYDFNSKTLMHTEGKNIDYSANIEGFKGYREKIAYIIEFVFYGFATALLGFILGIYLTEDKN